jgi:succinate dehydrogenase hydrophobic anchor subunit
MPGLSIALTASFLILILWIGLLHRWIGLLEKRIEELERRNKVGS